MHSFRSLLVAVTLVAGCTDHGGTVDRDGCTRLRDHVVDLRLADGASELGSDVEQHRRAMKQALGEEFIEHCVRTMSYEQLECSLKLSGLGDSDHCVDHASPVAAR